MLECPLNVGGSPQCGSTHSMWEYPLTADTTTQIQQIPQCSLMGSVCHDPWECLDTSNADPTGI
jgi:hypothetical protein